MSLFITSSLGKIVFLGCFIIWFIKIQKGSSLPVMVMVVICLLLPISNIKNHQPSTDIWQVQQIHTNYVEAKAQNQQVILYNLKDVLPDDIIEIKGEWQKIHSNQNFYGFSFQKWASHKNLYYSMYVNQYKVMKKSTSLKGKVYNRLKHLPASLQDKLKRSLFGIQDESDSLSYMVSSSGMHVSLLARCLEKLLGLWLTPFWAFVIVIAGMMGIGSCTVFSLALVRVIVFQVLFYLFKKETIHDRLGMTMICWLVWMPHSYMELCFVLPVLFRFVSIFQKQTIHRFIISMMILLPVQLITFYECDIIQIITFSIQRIGYAIYYGLSWVSFILKKDIALTWMHQCLALFQALPKFVVIGYPTLLWVGFWLKVNLKMLQGQKQKAYIQLLILLVIHQYQVCLNPFGEVMFLDVGQGDCALITLPFGQGTIFIDVAGHLSRDIPKTTIYPILRAKGIEHIDTVVISHEDFDHSGGVEQLRKLIPIEKIVDQKRKVIETGNLQIQGLLYDEAYLDKNENSQILLFELGGLRYLFMGDAGKTVEQRIMEVYPKLTADVLKLGHHGSNTSSDPMFLHLVHPNLALISSGYQNRYGHPHLETISTLKKQGIHFNNTAYQGATSILFFRNFHIFRTATDEFDIITTR